MEYWSNGRVGMLYWKINVNRIPLVAGLAGPGESYNTLLLADD